MVRNALRQSKDLAAGTLAENTALLQAKAAEKLCTAAKPVEATNSSKPITSVKSTKKPLAETEMCAEEPKHRTVTK